MASKEELLGNDEELRTLWNQLNELRQRIRVHTKDRYNRVNPFAEDLFDWEEKGTFCGAENTRVYDSATLIGDVELGNHVWVGPFCMLDGSGGLTIGDHCDISTGVKIYSHDTVKRALSGGKHPIEKAPVSIGKCCFIGSDAIILKGVEIGDYSVVAANSLVNDGVPPYTIVGGMPAKRIGHVEITGDNVVLHYGATEKSK